MSSCHLVFGCGPFQAGSMTFVKVAFGSVSPFPEANSYRVAPSNIVSSWGHESGHLEGTTQHPPDGGVCKHEIKGNKQASVLLSI